MTRRAAALQSGDNLPLYGVCCLMEEMVHQPPWLCSTGPAPAMPLTRSIPVAQRCYCLLTHYPFFTLHFKARPPLPCRLCMPVCAVAVLKHQ